MISFHDGRPAAAGLDAAALGFAAALAFVAAGLATAFLVAAARLVGADSETEEDIVNEMASGQLVDS